MVNVTHNRKNILSYIVTFVLLLSPGILKSQEIAEAVEYNFKRGFYTDSFQLVLSTGTVGGKIRYTLDGSKPTIKNGRDYTEPVTIDSNAMVRAYTLAPGYEDSGIKTHSYIFPEQVIRQQNRMKEDYGYDYSSEKTGKVFWTEEMDPEIVNNPIYKDEILEGLLDIPTISIVLEKEDLWGEKGIHWGDNLENRSDDFERECSIEMIFPKGYKGDIFSSWQENCGIKIQGGGSRWSKGTKDHKQSFTLVFKNKYGAGKLKHEIFADAPHGHETTCGKYDKIILRAGHNKSWGAKSDRSKTVFTRDQLGRDLQILMSGFGSHGTFVHLYLNGKYWGLYNPCERPDHNFLANHLGGESEDYFYAKGKDNKASDHRDGEPGQSRHRFYEANSKDYSEIPFSEMQNWVLVDQSIACFILYGYANPGDSPQYYYGNCNNPPGPVVWIPWDIEDSFGGGSRRTGPPKAEKIFDSKKRGDNGFKAFWTNIDFRMRFNDLVYKFFFNDGMMTDNNVIKTLDNLTDYIHKAIICESARWGDERSVNPMDRDDEWDAARLALRNDLDGRANEFIQKLQEAGYFSTLAAPDFISTKGKSHTNKVTLTINKGGANGKVFYTTDGSDPRKWDLTASVSETSIPVDGKSIGITINEATILKARTKNNDEWSPLHDILVLPDGKIIYKYAKIREKIIPYVIHIKMSEKEVPEILNKIHSGNNKLSKQNKLFFNLKLFFKKIFSSKGEEYTVYSKKGKELMSGFEDLITMENIPNGLYFIVIENEAYKILKTNYY